jgi:uncharacterized protein (DUF433 family)
MYSSRVAYQYGPGVPDDKKCFAVGAVGNLLSAGKGIIDFVASDHMNRITFDPAQCGGRPCIRGMRIRVTDVLELLGAGASFEEILDDYPYLEREDILASIEYAAKQADHPVLLTA